MSEIPGSSESTEALWQRLWPNSRLLEPLDFRRAPLLAAALCFAFGIALSHWHQTHGLILIAGLLAIAGATVLRWSRYLALLLTASLFVCLGWWCAEMQRPVSSAPLLRYGDGRSREVHGRVVRVRPLPERYSTQNPSPDEGEEEDAAPAALATVDLEVDAVQELAPDASRIQPVQGGIRLTTSRGVPHVRCGDVVTVPLRLREPERYQDPGVWQYADYLQEQGIVLRAGVRASTLHTDSHGPAPLACTLGMAQNWASMRLLRYVASSENRHSPHWMRLTAEDAGMLNAMLFGDRTRLAQPLRIGFERTGSFHLFVVSGMHVALLAGGLWWFFRRLGLQEISATFLTISLTSAYALLTGFGVPVQRALAMTAVVLVARALSRERNVFNALGAAAMAILVWSPQAVFETSFQMTSLTIVSVSIATALGEWSFLPLARATRNIDFTWLDAGVHPRRAQLRVALRMLGEPLDTLWRGAGRIPATLTRCFFWACELALVGFVMECCMALPMALYFHRATVFALPANIVSVPLVAIIAPLALLTFLCSLVGSWLALIPGWLTALLLHGVAETIRRISAVHIAEWRVPGPALPIALCAAACLALCCWMVRRSARWAIAGVALLLLTPLLALWPEPAHVHPGVLEVTAIDIGQGDSLFVVSPQGQTMLIDAGGPIGITGSVHGPTTGFDVGEEVVSPYLWSRQIQKLDVAVLTHAHSDHMGGLPAVLHNLHPRELWVSADSHSTTYQDLLREAQQLGITVRHWHAGDETEWSGVHISVLAPEAGYENTGDASNNDSLVLRMQYGNASALLEGDAEKPSENAMVNHNLLAPVTLLKVGHHGSATSSNAAFLEALHPQDAVISVGRFNTFGHPRQDVLDRLSGLGTRVYRTDKNGLTTFLLNPQGGVDVTTSASNP